MWYCQKGRGKHGQGLRSWGGMRPISAYICSRTRMVHEIAHLANIPISIPCILLLVYHDMSTAGLLTNNIEHTILGTSAFGKTSLKNFLLGEKSRGKIFPKVAFKYPLSSATQDCHKGRLLLYNRPKEIFTAAKDCDLPPLHKDWKENKNPKEFHSCE